MKGFYATSQCVAGIVLYEVGLFFITWWKSMHVTSLFLMLGMTSIGLGLLFFLGEPKKLLSKMSFNFRILKHYN